MKEHSSRAIFKELSARIESALETELTVVVCGPRKPSTQKARGPYRLREAVRHSLKRDQVLFLEELVESKEGQKTMRSLEKTLGKPPRLDQIEILLLKGKMIDKDVHIVEGAGAIGELVTFVADTDVFKKVYAFVNERHRKKRSYLEQSTFVQLIEAKRLYWFKNETDLKLQVKNALNPNRIHKSGIL